ncbi:mediator of RNA polymerase II transcription subunit 19 [Pelobates cultripes]|uniref:Mediator of RNA polymerase II transcription subunit 19 n=1 Tax=Pelobates cultripes TaxID=61616 RepID=A0AAD1TCP5_PELCU|nr:mediator of RNA polymerase II transcription subunit 19 [Pelobates cultripes]
MMEGFSALFASAEPPLPSGPGAPSGVPASSGGFGSSKPQVTGTANSSVPGPPLPPPPPLSVGSAGDDSARRSPSGPFYLLRELPGLSDLTGSVNLIVHYNLEHSFSKFCGKKVKEKLSNFLPDLPGMIDTPGSQDNSSLRSLIEKPPICGNSFTPLTGALLTGFRLHAGPLPEQCRLMHIQPPKKKNKKHKTRTQEPAPPETPSDSDHRKKKKKQREDDPERRRKKKDKKKKKSRHSPEHPGAAGSQSGLR